MDDIVAVAANVEVQALQPNGRDALKRPGMQSPPWIELSTSEPDSKRWWNRR